MDCLWPGSNFPDYEFKSMYHRIRVSQGAWIDLWSNGNVGHVSGRIILDYIGQWSSPLVVVVVLAKGMPIQIIIIRI